MTRAAATLVRIFLEAIAEASEGIPSGHLYATCMGAINLNTYLSIIGALKRLELITEKAHLLQVTEAGRVLLSK
jgi:hypothetical protein